MAAKKKVPAISVRSVSRNGFRRAGFAFTAEGQIFTEGDITEEQFKAIKDESALIVEETTTEVESTEK